jgi:hypothetical protein
VRRKLGGDAAEPTRQFTMENAASQPSGRISMPLAVGAMSSSRSSSRLRARVSSPSPSSFLTSGVSVLDSSPTRSPKAFIVMPLDSHSAIITRSWGYVSPTSASAFL